MPAGRSFRPGRKASKWRLKPLTTLSAAQQNINIHFQYSLFNKRLCRQLGIKTNICESRCLQGRPTPRQLMLVLQLKYRRATLLVPEHRRGHVNLGTRILRRYQNDPEFHRQCWMYRSLLKNIQLKGDNKTYSRSTCTSA